MHTTYTLDSRTLQRSASWKPQTIARSLHRVADSQQPATSTEQLAAEQPTVSRSSLSAECALLVPSLRVHCCAGWVLVGTASKKSLAQTFVGGGEVSLFPSAHVCYCMCQLSVYTLSALYTHISCTIAGANFCWGVEVSLSAAPAYQKCIHESFVCTPHTLPARCCSPVSVRS